MSRKLAKKDITKLGSNEIAKIEFISCSPVNAEYPLEPDYHQMPCSAGCGRPIQFQKGGMGALMKVPKVCPPCSDWLLDAHGYH